MRSSQIPPIVQGGSLIAQVNDRLRRLEALSTAAPTGAATGSAVQIVLTVPGRIGIRSAATPLVSLPIDVRPNELAVLLAKPPVGGRIRVEVSAGETPVGSVTVAEGQTSASSGSVGTIRAGAVIVLAVREVGLTFPGEDLTVMVRLR